MPCPQSTGHCVSYIVPPPAFVLRPGPLPRSTGHGVYEIADEAFAGLKKPLAACWSAATPARGLLSWW